MTYDKAQILKSAHAEARLTRAMHRSTGEAVRSYASYLSSAMRRLWAKAKAGAEKYLMTDNDDTMTSERALQIIRDAMQAADTVPFGSVDALLRFLLPTGGWMDPGNVKQLIGSCEELLETAGVDASAKEMAVALKVEMLRVQRDVNDYYAPELDASFQWYMQDAGDVTVDTPLSFGKHEGRSIRDLLDDGERDYVNWMAFNLTTPGAIPFRIVAAREINKLRKAEPGPTYLATPEVDLVA